MKKIAVTGPIGYETGKAVYEENKATLDLRFPKFWLKNFLEAEPIPKDWKSDGTAIEITEGGLFGALWQACEGEKELFHPSGCEVYVEKIPILQEAVEICELYDVDPYEASSKGIFLIVDEEEKIRNCGGQLTVIGTMCEGKDRVVVMKDKETRRFLTPPKRQAKDLANR